MSAPVLAVQAVSAPPSPACGRDVLAVVPCLNEAAFLSSVLDGLLAEIALAQMLIVVVDGGSTDGSQAIVERYAQTYDRVRLLHNPQRLQSAAVNLAAREYGTDRRWLVRLDGHARYPASFVTDLLATAESTGADSVVVGMRAEGESCFQVATALAQNSRLGTGGAAHRNGAPSGWVDHGHHALLKLDSFNLNGGYNERFSHNEDAEYDLRLHRRGGRIWLERAAEIVYYPRSNARSLFNQYLCYGRGRARTTLLHRHRLKARQILPLCVAPALVLAPFGLLYWPLVTPAAFWAVACLAAGLWVGRAGPACRRMAGIPAMIMHLAWSAGFLQEVMTVHRTKLQAAVAA